MCSAAACCCLLPQAQLAVGLLMHLAVVSDLQNAAIVALPLRQCLSISRTSPSTAPSLPLTARPTAASPVADWPAGLVAGTTCRQRLEAAPASQKGCPVSACPFLADQLVALQRSLLLSLLPVLFGIRIVYRRPACLVPVCLGSTATIFSHFPACITLPHRMLQTSATCARCTAPCTSGDSCQVRASQAYLHASLRLLSCKPSSSMLPLCLYVMSVVLWLIHFSLLQPPAKQAGSSRL